MSLMEELAQNGISAEDLEKAASMRLFEKVAANENINLSELPDEQVEELFTHFVNEVLPELVGDGGGEAAAGDGGEADSDVDPEKAASIFLFQKTAAAENIDLNSLDEDQLNGLYNHFLDNVLPDMINGGAAEPAAKQASAEEVEEAQAKLAEVEILGRHMARAYSDELNKIAAAGETPAGKTASAPGTLFDKLAAERAGEILEANGIDPETGAQKQTDIDALVNARAAEMLAEAGYVFEE